MLPWEDGFRIYPPGEKWLDLLPMINFSGRIAGSTLLYSSCVHGFFTSIVE
jgi:hypothetical protein